MSANFYDLLKYAATGIASPGMTYYDRMRASTLMGGAAKTLTGIPPLTFKADGKPLISWNMKGNGQQTGTPSPDNIIMPTFCGVRTWNLLNLATQTIVKNGVTVSVSGSTITMSGASYGETSSADAVWESLSFTLPAGTYSLNRIESGHGVSRFVRANGVQILGATATTFTLAEETTCNIGFYIYRKADEVLTTDYMLNLGSTALPYEPYGYKIPITCGGQTVPVYLGQVQTVRRIKKLVLTGEDGEWKKSATRTGSFYLRFGYVAIPGFGLCDRAVNVGNVDAYSSYGKMFVEKSGLNILINLWLFDTNISVDDFKAYLASEYAAGHPVTIWYVLAEPTTAIVNEPLAKVGTYADELHSTDAGVSIPAVRGQNVLTVDTDLQPSEMSITYRG